MDTQFGERLKFVRERRGITQAGLAEKCGTDVTTFSHYERGTRQPGVTNLRALCRELMVSADYLLGLSERMSP